MGWSKLKFKFGCSKQTCHKKHTFRNIRMLLVTKNILKKRRSNGITWQFCSVFGPFDEASIKRDWKVVGLFLNG